MALPIRMSLSVDFHKINGRNSSTHQCAISLFLYLDDWLIRFDSQLTNLSHNILLSNSTKSRFHTKSKEVRFDTNTEIHFYRHGMSDSTEYSQGTSRDRVDSFSLTIKTFLSQSQVSAQTFLSLLGKLSAAVDFILLGRLHL